VAWGAPPMTAGSMSGRTPPRSWTTKSRSNPS
jgi:hypothetical protein